MVVVNLDVTKQTRIFSFTQANNNMKLVALLSGFIFLGIYACQNVEQKNTDTTLNTDTATVVKTEQADSIPQEDTGYALALSENGIQMIKQSNGASNEISYGNPLTQTINTIEKVLKSKANFATNTECGAGVLKMATWDNGLTLLFQEKKNEWLFAGWAAHTAKNADLKLTTMAGIGVGSTRKEMESAYVINVAKTSLGYEFATKSGNLFGILEGAEEDAKITNLWSGVSCNFR